MLRFISDFRGKFVLFFYYKSKGNVRTHIYFFNDTILWYFTLTGVYLEKIEFVVNLKGESGAQKSRCTATARQPKRKKNTE